MTVMAESMPVDIKRNEHTGSNEDDRESNIEDNLETFMYYIVHNINWKDLLCYQHFHDTDRRLFRDIANRDPVEAVRRMLQFIISDLKGMPKRYSLLLKLLETTGNSKVVSILNGRAMPRTDSSHKRNLETHFMFLCESLLVLDILADCVSHKLIVSHEAENIQAKLRSDGNYAAAIDLILILSRRQIHWYPLFIKILAKNNLNEIGEKIDKNYYRSLSAGKPYPDQDQSCIPIRKPESLPNTSGNDTKNIMVGGGETQGLPNTSGSDTKKKTLGKEKKKGKNYLQEQFVGLPNTSGNDTKNIMVGGGETQEAEGLPTSERQYLPDTNKSIQLIDALHEPTWKKVLKTEFEQVYFKKMEKKLVQESDAGKVILPRRESVFNAFYLTPLNKVKVVIIGQEPYINEAEAMGLCWSVPRGIKIPSTLMNIFKELERDPAIKNFKIPDHGCLELWAKQGVLLLDATLTVEKGKKYSHEKEGWQRFTDKVCDVVSDQCDFVVFMLWGTFAQKKERHLDLKKHKVIKTSSPASQGQDKGSTPFKGSGCFSKCNEALKDHGQSTIDWSL